MLTGIHICCIHNIHAHTVIHVTNTVKFAHTTFAQRILLLASDRSISQLIRMPYGFVRIYFILFYFFFRRQGFRITTFDRQAGPLQNFNRSHVMVIGRSVSFSTCATPGWGRGAPQTSQTNPPPIFLAFYDPRKMFLRKKNLVTKNFHRHPRSTPRPRPALRTLTSILVQ